MSDSLLLFGDAPEIGWALGRDAWGRGEDGAVAPAGIYFFDLVAAGERAMRRVAIVR